MGESPSAHSPVKSRRVPSAVAKCHGIYDEWLKNKGRHSWEGPDKENLRTLT